MGRIAGNYFALVAVVFCSPLAAHAAEPLLQVNQAAVDATFVGFPDDEALEFQTANENQSMPLSDFVRWSNPRENLDRYEAILVDGSRLVLSESWTGKQALQVSAETVTLSTAGFGKIVLPRTKLRAVLLNAPASSLKRSRLRDQLVSLEGKHDQLWLANGDMFTGQLLEIGRSGSAIKFSFDGVKEPVLLPIDRVAGIALASSSIPKTKGKLAVGWREGSFLVVNSLSAVKKSLHFKLACEVKVKSNDLREVVYLQSLESRAVYLSDLEAIDYHHKPFLTILWQYQRDRNLQGGPLTVNHLIYPKGLAMHTASRLTYDLPKRNLNADTSERKNRFSRFAAQVAVDDLTGGQGSVVFQVFLRQAGELRLAFTAPVVRGGEAPLPISVDLGEAVQIVLAVEYADRGDQRDHANWLDARLE